MKCTNEMTKQKIDFGKKKMQQLNCW